MRHIPCLAIVMVGCLALSVIAEPPAVNISATETSVQVDIGGKPFTTYRFAADEKPPFVRPFFYPVLAADGTEVTSDQLRTNPKEHPHHRSIWVGHGDVNGVDHWSFAQKPAPAKQRHVRFDQIGGDGFVESLVWDDLNGQPLLNELRTARFISYGDGSRAIDLTVKLTAAAAEVNLADTKEAGLCSVRVAKSISDKPTLINSTGAEAHNAKEEAAKIWGKPADWCDESGEINGKAYGIAIFDHPSNPRHPTTWHARTYGLVAPNEFGLHEFDKKNVPAHAGDFKIARGDSATFRFRVIVHAGDAKAAGLDEKYKDFVATK
jgi:hypothetical protein